MMDVRESSILLQHSGVPADGDLASADDRPFAPQATFRKMNAYRQSGGYGALERSLALSPEDVCSMVKASGLIGRGGAGYPTGQKWEIARKVSGDQKYVICNAEEGEPGTFKDRVLLEQNPHQVLEGLIIGAYAIGASQGYIYINAEFEKSLQVMREAIKEATAAGYLGAHIRGTSFSFRLDLFLSAGAYICGEETALINSIEGKRGVPRNRPPYPTERGLFQKPTVVNNVETLANIPPILCNGPEWYRQLGVAGSYGTKLVSISGNVRRPGVYEVELGKYTVGDLIHGLALGVAGNKRVKAILPGGASTSFLTESDLRVPVDYRSLRAVGSSLGTGGMIVFDEDQSIPNVVKHLFDFYRQESCGYCGPCRLGTNAAYQILRRITEPILQREFSAYHALQSPEDREYLEQLQDIAFSMKLLSRCGLGQSATDPLRSSLTLFPGEYVALIRERQREYELLMRQYAQLEAW